MSLDQDPREERKLSRIPPIMDKLKAHSSGEPVPAPRWQLAAGLVHMLSRKSYSSQEKTRNKYNSQNNISHLINIKGHVFVYM